MYVETKPCNYCQRNFTYERKRRPRKYCSSKCSTAYHNKFSRDKDGMQVRVAQYYQDYPEKKFLSATKSSAKKRGLAFGLSEAWFKSRLERGVCEITGLPVKSKPYQPNERGVRSFYSPSIDRIDNNQGYIESNCRIVCWGLNLVKSTFTDRDLNALSLSLMLNNLPKSSQSMLLELLPPTMVSSLPSGHPFNVGQ